ncbi:MAG: signal peptidase I [Chlamydiota bacterium]
MNISLRPAYLIRKKCTHILRASFHRYTKKKNTLNEEQRATVEYHLKALQTALLQKDTKAAKEQASTLEKLIETLLPKSSFEKIRTTVLGLGVALCFAVIIRLLWFELYEIPTGSMRPTLKEKDHLMVSKTTFGINIPFSTGHFYFSPDLVERNGIFVFTGENMDIRDVDTRYFYLFPGKKQYIKRLMGKPEDTLYFYGGLLYGIDKEGTDISKELQPARLDLIEHIPFLQFEGTVTTPSYPTNGIYTPVILRQMNEPIAKLSVFGFHQTSGQVLSTPLTPNIASDKSIQYGDLWGMNNFGMARLLTKEQLLQNTSENSNDLSTGTLYMEIKHHPSLQDLRVSKDDRGRMRPQLDLSTSIIPLTEKHLKTLFSNLYTVRFLVKDERAYSYGRPESILESPYLPKLQGIPDGTYEFYYGTAYKISFQGLAFELERTHPLYDFSPERVQLFYNLGMEFDTRFSPENRYTPYFPLRYVYFRDKSLYALGAPLMTSDDSTLVDFENKEAAKQTGSSTHHPYLPFMDMGPPTNPDGTLNIPFIQKYGLTVPKKTYLALGDNHAVSADSRVFGFVPQENLRGAPDFLFWPFGSRFGHPNQPPYPFINFPRSIIWILAATSIGGALYLQRKRNKLPLL